MPKVHLGYGPLTIKYIMFVFNLIFFIAGLTLIIIGAVAQGFFREYIKFFDAEFKTPAIGIIILGAIILFISFFGCCGARTNNVCLLRIFGFLLVTLIVCEAAAGISIAVLKSDIEVIIIKNMNETMKEYGGNDTLATQTWDDLQESHHCCGTFNYTDWGNTTWSLGRNVPDSCCKEYFEGCGKDVIAEESIDQIYDVSCSEALKNSALQNLGAIIGGAVALALIQVIGAWMSCCLINAIKENYEVI